MVGTTSSSVVEASEPFGELFVKFSCPVVQCRRVQVYRPVLVVERGPNSFSACEIPFMCREFSFVDCAAGHVAGIPGGLQGRNEAFGEAWNCSYDWVLKGRDFWSREADA